MIDGGEGEVIDDIGAVTTTSANTTVGIAVDPPIGRNNVLGRAKKHKAQGWKTPTVSRKRVRPGASDHI